MILKLFNLNSGYLIFDETDINKSYSCVIQGLSWIFSHRFNRFVFGYHLVVIAWTNNKITIPLGWKVYNPDSKKKKTDLALELLVFCLADLNIKPKGILFDSFYSSYKILKFIVNRKLFFYTQVPKSRLFNGIQLKHTHNNSPYWNSVGLIKGKIEVRIVKHRRKYFMTNDITLDPKVVSEVYKIR